MLIPIADADRAGLEVRSKGGRHTITVPLATDLDGTRWVAVEARLWGGHWRGVEVHEFKFAIIHFDSVMGEPVEIFDRYLAAGYLESVRRLVLPTACAAAEALIAHVRPRVIYRATYVTRPPEKALLKHRIITDTIVRSRYEVVLEGTDGHHRHFWIMTMTGDV